MENTIKDLKQNIIKKATEDKAFRDKLTGNPKEAIEEELGIKLPLHINVSVYERGPNDFHISLPAGGDELSDDQLSGVSGGWNMCKSSQGEF